MVNNSDTKVSYQGNGQTTVFPFSFPFIQRDYIKVAIYDSLTGETKTIDSDYYVDTVANTVIYPGYEPGQEPAEALRPPILPATSTITIYRQTDVDQLTDLGEKYPLKDIENMADKLTEIIQEQAETLGRTVKVPVGDPKTPEEKLTDLQNYVSDAANSAKNAADSEASAQRAAEAAATSEANAAESERLASGYADTASDAASRAEDSAISARAYNAPDYDNETTYQAGDVVTYTDGNSYRALQETTGNEPPNIIYWQKVTDYVGDNFFEIDEYGYIVPMDSPSHSRYWRVDQNGYIVPIEGGDGGYRPDTRSLSAEYLNVTNEGYVKHLRADDVNAGNLTATGNVTAGMVTTPQANVTTLTANAVNAQSASVTEISAESITADESNLEKVTSDFIKVKRLDEGSSTRPLAVCHRGYTNGDDFRAIENTIFALGDAERAGFQGVEIDFRKDVNGQIVCLHDATVDRVTDGTGNIADIDYTSVHLLNKYGQSTDNYLSTIEEIVTMAKVWNMWLIVDGSKNICSMNELITLFESYNYHNYVFFEYENDNETSPELYYQQYLNTPTGIRIVLDPPSHSITSSTLDDIADLFSDRIDDVYIRTVYSGDEQYFTLIKSYGFKIMHNTNSNISIPPTIPLVDIILSEESIYRRYPSKLIAKSNSLQGAYDDAVKNTLSTFMARPKTGSLSDWPFSGANNACGMIYRNENGNFGFQFGFSFEETMVFRRRYNGAWSRWYQPIKSIADESLTGIPTSGTFKQGDIIMNPSPAAGGFIGWICVTAGTPGTWKGFGLIQS